MDVSMANIWGQGQIFALSAIDAKTSMADDFAGILCADRIGIKFLKKVNRELAVVGYKTENLTFDAVCGDYICAKTDCGNYGKECFDSGRGRT